MTKPKHNHNNPTALEKIIIEIAGNNVASHMNDLYCDFSHNHSFMKSLAAKINIDYIETVEDFESSYSSRINDLTDKQLVLARANGIIPCTNDMTGENYIAIGSLKAFDIQTFVFTKIILVSLEIITFYLPMLGNGEFDQIDQAKKYVEAILTQAWEMKANDVHIHPEAGVYAIKYAIDDKVSPTISTKKYDFMDNVIAVLQKMARVEVRSAKPFQDGQIIFFIKGRKTEWRYHEDRTLSGKRVVIRQSHAYRDTTTLESLRYPPEVASMIREVCERKSGMVLFCGKTGHGKSTAMTTELLELKKKFGWFITMIEDNPEVVLDGIDQITVNEEGDGQYKYGYAEAIRASLRSDIDVLMVAEIRDALTANSAFRAALTGHLAMSTIHVETVSSVVPRLLDLGVDKHTIYSSVSGIFIQLLIPALCPKCKEIDLNNKNYFKKGNNQKCSFCNGEGYASRVPINECAILTQGENDFIRKKYLSYSDTLQLQLEMGNIDKETMMKTLQDSVELKK